MKTDYYFESHITIDPVEGEKLEQLKSLVINNGFIVAKLLMEKNNPSKLDSFMTKRSKNYEDIFVKTVDTVNILKNFGYGVRRYKIENIVLDVKI